MPPEEQNRPKGLESEPAKQQLWHKIPIKTGGFFWGIVTGEPPLDEPVYQRAYTKDGKYFYELEERQAAAPEPKKTPPAKPIRETAEPMVPAKERKAQLLPFPECLAQVNKF